MRTLILACCAALSLGTAACGGGSTETAPLIDNALPRVPGDPPPTPPAQPGVPNPGPQIALILSNGHSPILANYLGVATGPQLAAAIGATGLTLETTYFTDDATSYEAFVNKLRQIRDEWIDGVDVPTRVVIVGHSHGCVRSHAATRAVDDCPIELLVDLDGSSIGWTAATHAGENALIGGAPEGAYAIGVQRLCDGVTSAGGAHDLEDVVFDHVRKGYEVRSGARILDPANFPNIVEYDERWNVRPDGSATDLDCLFSGTTHSEVAAPGATLDEVQTWILDQLTGP